MSERAAEYRRQAEECRKRAETAKHADIKRQYEETAEGWLALARDAELQERGYKQPTGS
jgi:hypothetical protein